MEHILNDLRDEKTILVVAHGNSLRSIVMYIEDISTEEIPHIEIPTGVPIVYTFTKSMKLLGKKFL